MPTRNINLTDHYDSFVAEQLATGRFQNASEVVRTALHLLEQRNAEEEAKLEALRREVMIGVEQYERGETIQLNTDEDIDRYFDDLANRVDENSGL